MTTETTPTIRLLELTTEAQDLFPDHTYKAVTRLIENWPVEKRIEWLEIGIAEFKRGMAA